MVSFGFAAILSPLGRPPKLGANGNCGMELISFGDDGKDDVLLGVGGFSGNRIML